MTTATSKTTKTTISRIQKSIEIQRKIRATIEASKLSNIPVDVLDVDRMLEKCDEIIDLLESRIDAVERRSTWPNGVRPTW